MPPGSVPPGGVPPWQPPPKKSKTGLVIGIVVVVLLLAGAGVGVYFWQPWNSAGDDSTADSGESEESGDESEGDDDSASQEDGPAAVVEEAWFAPDWDTAKGYFCTDYAQQMEEDGRAEQYAAPPPDEDFNVVNENVGDDTAEVTVETTVAGQDGPTDGQVQVSLEIEEDEWRICQIAAVEE